MVGSSDGRVRRVLGDEAVRYFRERNREGEASGVRTKQLRCESVVVVVVAVAGPTQSHRDDASRADIPDVDESQTSRREKSTRHINIARGGRGEK